MKKLATHLNFSLLQESFPVFLGTLTQPGKFLKDGTVKETKDTLVYTPLLKILKHIQNEMIVSEVGASKCIVLVSQFTLVCV